MGKPIPDFQFGIPTCLSGTYVLGRQWWLSSGQLPYYAHPGFSRIHYASGHYNLPTQIYLTIDALAENICNAYHCVRIEKNTFGVLNQAPTVQFSKGHTQFRSFHQGQVNFVFAVK